MAFWHELVEACRADDRRREFVVGWGSTRRFFISSFVVWEYWGDEDALVIHVGMIVGMQGVSIRMQPLKGDDYQREASKRRYDLCGRGMI